MLLRTWKAVGRGHLLMGYLSLSCTGYTRSARRIMICFFWLILQGRPEIVERAAGYR